MKIWAFHVNDFTIWTSHESFGFQIVDNIDD